MVDRHLFDHIVSEMRGNEDQIAAINEKGHCVVLAGPGSGKTRTLTAAMSRALLEDVSEPHGIACITYNNECAIELESRLARLGIEPDTRVFIGTVHSFALSQVIIPYARCVLPDFPTKLQIASRTQCEAAVHVAYKNTIRGNENPQWRWRVAQEKRRRDIDRRHSDWLGKNPELARFIEAYEKELRRQGLIDFDDMPLLATRMIQDHEWIRNSIKAKFPVLFVDEYQDLGTALHELVLQLCFKAGVRLFAVGDPDQSIYKFIGADPDLLKELSQRKDVKKILLPFNYRCGTDIIEASNAALGEERGYKAPTGAHQGKILFDPVEGDLDAQADHVMKILIPSLTANGIKLEEIAILYRVADHGDILATSAESNKLPFIRADKNALAPRNNRLSRLIEATASWVTGGWKEADPPFHRLSSEATNFVFGAGASQAERHRIESGLMSFLHPTINTEDSTHTWLLKFKDALITPWRSQTRTLSDDWDEIDRMLTKTDLAQGGSDITLPHFTGRMTQSGRLNLSTLHSSKGREFDVVILFGLNREEFPNPRDKDRPEQVRETRRLFYVAVTRARKELRLVFKKKHYSPWIAEVYRRMNRK